MKRNQPVKAKSKSSADSEQSALTVLREFVEDVRLAHGTGRNFKIDAAALDWPDLAATYDKAVAVLKAACNS